MMLSSIHKKILTLVTAILLLGACEDMLVVEPQDAKVRDEFWQIESDVEAAVLGSYNALQQSTWEFFLWGELRGELIQTYKSGSDIKDKYYNIEGINELNILEGNQVCKWGDIYSAINKLNTVIAFAPDAAAKDNTFTEEELNAYIGECITLRALCYFYLARTFKEFPYITEASDNDQQDYIVPAMEGSLVLDFIVADLKKAEPLVKKEYTGDNFKALEINNEELEKAYQKGRVTTPVVWAILTDVLLTQDNYSEAIVYADKIIADERFALVPGASWNTIFAEGNTEESIFELQFAEKYDTDNNGDKDDGNIAKWFIGTNAEGKGYFGNRSNRSTNTFSLWEGDEYSKIEEVEDFRGRGGTLHVTSKGSVWKWAGLSPQSDDGRGNMAFDANYIFYRLADVLLMKAEALNRLDKTQEALDILTQIGERANRTGFPEYTASSVIEFEDLLLDERGRELAMEGKRWFDLLRIANRQQNYEVIGLRKAKMHDRLSEQSKWLAKVYNPLSWYLPIHKDELELNHLLEQNSYYEQ